jgi:hypothetical protein
MTTCALLGGVLLMLGTDMGRRSTNPYTIDRPTSLRPALSQQTFSLHDSIFDGRDLHAVLIEYCYFTMVLP